MSENNENAKNQARAQLDSIVEMVDNLLRFEDTDNEDALEDARQAISDDPLSVEVRSGWTNNMEAPFVPAEFKILLCTGGPAVQLIGELNDYNEPESVKIQYQDWFTKWETLHDISDSENDAMLEYCRCFYFGE